MTGDTCLVPIGKIDNKIILDMQYMLTNAEANLLNPHMQLLPYSLYQVAKQG